MSPAKILIFIGLTLVLLGLLWHFFPGFFQKLGQLPGDISWSKGNIHFHFPLATSLLLSLIISLIFWLFKK